MIEDYKEKKSYVYVYRLDLKNNYYYLLTSSKNNKIDNRLDKHTMNKYHKKFKDLKLIGKYKAEDNYQARVDYIVNNINKTNKFYLLNNYRIPSCKYYIVIIKYWNKYYIKQTKDIVTLLHHIYHDSENCYGKKKFFGNIINNKVANIKVEGPYKPIELNTNFIKICKQIYPTGDHKTLVNKQNLYNILDEFYFKFDYKDKIIYYKKKYKEEKSDNKNVIIYELYDPKLNKSYIGSTNRNSLKEELQGKITEIKETTDKTNWKYQLKYHRYSLEIYKLEITTRKNKSKKLKEWIEKKSKTEELFNKYYTDKETNRIEHNNKNWNTNGIILINNLTRKPFESKEELKKLLKITNIKLTDNELNRLYNRTRLDVLMIKHPKLAQLISSSQKNKSK